MFFPRSQNWIQSWPWGCENSGRNLQKGVRIKELHKSENASMFWGYYSIFAGTPWQFAVKCGARAPNALVQEHSQGCITKLFLSIVSTLGVTLCFDGICFSIVLINLRQSMYTLKTVFALTWACVQRGEILLKTRCCRNAAVSPGIHCHLANLGKQPSDLNTGTKWWRNELMYTSAKREKNWRGQFLGLLTIL